ncbi:MAG: hypothetical protein H8E98_02015 [Bacteroidetes bacterium]|nr:hypothetical protein [Bacteroidota bacterium]
MYPGTHDKQINQIAIPTSEQIHILGNKQDIDGFKEFVVNPTQQDAPPELPKTSVKEKVITRKTVKESLSRTLKELGEEGLSERLGKASATDLNRIIKMYGVENEFVTNKQGNIVLTKNEGKKAVSLKLSKLIQAKQVEPKTESMDINIQTSKKSVGSVTKIKSNFQELGVSKQPLISEEPELALEIETRLKKHYPFIKPVKVQGIIKKHGVKAVGMAVGNVATWSESKGGIDVAPHEFAHIYIDMLDDSNIIKQGIANFNGKEDLAEHIGNYYADRIQDKTLKQKLERWLKLFWSRVKAFLGNKKAVNDIIAEKFFQGKEFKVKDLTPVYTADNGVWYKKLDDVDEDGIDVDIEPRGTKGSTKNVENYFSHVFNSYVAPIQHAEMVQIALNNKSFGKFKKEFVSYVKDTFVDPIFSETSMEFDNRAKQFFNKSKSIIKTATSEEDEGRFYLNMIFQSFGFNKVNVTPEIQINNGTDLVTGRKMSERHSTNFVEDEGRTTVYHLGMKQVIKHIVSKDFYVPANIQLTLDTIYRLDKMFLSNYDGSGNLLFFLGAKGGDNSQMLIGGVPSNILEMNKEQIIKALEEEVGRTIKQSDFDNFIKDGETFEKDGINIWNQIYGKHEVTKKIKGNDYLMREKNVNDTFNRFRIDFTEGYVAIGSGPDQLMIVDGNEIEVKVRDGNFFKSSIDYSLYDGWKLVGSERMDLIQDSVGRNPELEEGTDLKAIKVAQRYLSNDGNDYIGEKMMDMTPFPGMEFYKKGSNKPFARVAENDLGLTYFEQLDENGKVIDEFYSMVSTNEAKQISGKFTQEQGGFYKVHEIPENATKIIIMPGEKAKSNPAHPLAWWEQVWSPILNQDIFDSATSAIKRYIDISSKKYMNKLIEAEDDLKALRDMIWKPPVEGRLPTELQQILDLLNNGAGLDADQYLSQVLPQLRNSEIVDGLFKLRQKGMGTKLHIKPRVHLEVKEKEFMVSVDNVVFVDIILDKMNLKRDDNWNIDILNNWLSNNSLEVLLSKPPIEKAGAVGVYTLKELVPRGHGDVIFLNEIDVAGPLKADSDGDTAQIEIYKDKGLINSIKKLTNSREFKIRDKNILSNLDLYPEVIEGTSSSSREDVARTISNMSYIDGALAQFVIAKMVSNKMAMKGLSFKLFGKKYEVKEPNEMVAMAVVLDKSKITKEIFNDLYAEGDYFVTKDGVKIENYEDYQASEIAHSVTTYENSLTVYMQMAADPKYGLLPEAGFNEYFIAKRMFKEDGKKISKTNATFYVYGSDILDNLNKVILQFNDSSFKNGKLLGREMSFQDIFKESKRLNDILSLPSKEQGASILTEMKRKYRTSISELSVNGKIGITEYLLMQPNKHIERRNKRLEARLEKYLPIPVDESGNSTESEETKKLRIQATIKLATRSNIVPFVYRNKSFSQRAHRNAIVKIINNMNKAGLTIGKKQITGFTKDEANNAYKFATKVGNEFYKIYNEEAKFIKKEENKNIVYEYNPRFQEFIAKHFPEFKLKLNDKEQSLSTLFFLTGIIRSGEHFRVRNVTRLLPIELMDKQVLKGYLKIRRNEMLNNQITVKQKEYTHKVSKLFENIRKHCP